MLFRSNDGRYVLVTNTSDGTISVINAITLEEEDLVPDDPARPHTLGIQRIVLPPGARPNHIAISPLGDGMTGVVTDKFSGHIYEFYTHPEYLRTTGAFAGQVLATPRLVSKDIPVNGLIGIDYSPDGQWLTVTSAGLGSEFGADNTAESGYIFVLSVIGGEFAPARAVFATGPKPWGVTRSPVPGENVVGVAIRGSEPTGYSIIDLDTLDRKSVV